ncbi:alpha/beta-hydrolase [Polychaeton citri CBS 116435]|uniref:Carboxylic ester hydrolase n=1 Tax=Polychaeton citri CBS 116435 TaxID=1314669 RepID=A0A9P4Q252_9PEZI|nr:alpha/beta-hydrolase [Polychaeton citri CBS 116435]
MKEQYSTTPHTFNAGPLGFFRGLTVSKSGAGESSQILRYYGGVPYAQPPTGPLRFRRPQPLPPCYRHGTATSPGDFTSVPGTKVCPQPAWLGKSPPAKHVSEDCLQLNIWVPAKARKDEKAWPVLFYIHGGFLQWGDANMSPQGLAPLLDAESGSAFEAIIVQPAYRLNLFGFLASKELQNESTEDSVGNLGFWDQRAALEWTCRNISLFGGDQDNITVAGYSAGSHSTFQQLAHDLYFVPDNRAIIKRAIMWSNSPGVQAKNLEEQQLQFDELLSALHIPLSLPSSEKLSRLRSIPASKLVKVQSRLSISEFRSTTDDAFISASTIAHINSGDFARRMRRRGIRLFNGECAEEHNLYRAWRTPTTDSYAAIYTRLCADYPRAAVDKLLYHYCGNTDPADPPAGYKTWIDFWGYMYATMQVHSLERGFHAAITSPADGLRPGKDLFRYRFEWRAKCVDAFLPPEWGVTHATDMAIWFWGLDYSKGLEREEKRALKIWNRDFAAFVRGEEMQGWDTVQGDVKKVRRLKANGESDIWFDNAWVEGVKVWEVINGKVSSITGGERARL